MPQSKISRAVDALLGTTYTAIRFHMAQLWSHNKKQLLVVFIYSSIYPITNIVGGNIMDFGIFVSLPFLPFAWMGGMIVVWIAGSEKVYLLCAFISIFIQVWLVVVGLSFTRKNKNV
jgi:hypothetical protein